MSENQHFSIAIAKDKLATMPVVTYPGRITVISTQAEAGAAIDSLMQSSVVGFDTETKPSFRKGHMNEVALMQVATADHAYLFRLNLIGIDPVRPLLESDAITKIGLSLKDDFQMLSRRGKVSPSGFVDLQTLVKTYHITDASLQKIYGIIFNARISKAQRLSNWEAPKLTHSQQAYASIDAWACLKIYNYLTNGLFHPDESPYIVPDSPKEPDTPQP